jgi:hypothetical protein
MPATVALPCRTLTIPVSAAIVARTTPTAVRTPIVVRVREVGQGSSIAGGEDPLGSSAPAPEGSHAGKKVEEKVSAIRRGPCVGRAYPRSKVSSDPVHRALAARRAVKKRRRAGSVEELAEQPAAPLVSQGGRSQALREVYDGLYTRDVGAGGDEHLEWRGRVGLVAGATGGV